MTAMKQVGIVGVYDDSGSGALVLLSESQTPTRVLPIMIGAHEAHAIGSALMRLRTERPGTHDLMAALLTRSDMRLDEVAITELRDGVFHAELFVETLTGLHRETARPSDAIALAVRCGAPIVVAPAVLDEAAVDVRHRADEPFSDDEINEIVVSFSAQLNTISPSDFESPVPDDVAPERRPPELAEGEPEDEIGWIGE